MTKRKLIHFFFTFIVIAPSYTQGFILEGNPYLGISSYDGTTSNDYYSLVITENWGTVLYAEDWRVTVRLTGDIVSQDGTKVFPSNKIGFILVSTGGQPSSTILDVSDISRPLLPRDAERYAGN